MWNNSNNKQAVEERGRRLREQTERERRALLLANHSQHSVAGSQTQEQRRWAYERDVAAWADAGRRGVERRPERGVSQYSDRGSGSNVQAAGRAQVVANNEGGTPRGRAAVRRDQPAEGDRMSRQLLRDREQEKKDDRDFTPGSNRRYHGGP